MMPILRILIEFSFFKESTCHCNASPSVILFAYNEIVLSSDPYSLSLLFILDGGREVSEKIWRDRSIAPQKSHHFSTKVFWNR